LTTAPEQVAFWVMQWPPEQVWPIWHTVPQLPQLFVSLLVSPQPALSSG
jgi:hypothetical protein